MSELHHTNGRSARLERVLHDLLGQAPEFQAAAVVSFDGLPMASALPYGMDEDRVAAMSAALLSLGERAADNFGRGALSQVYVEGENGTVFLVSADDEAVLVAVGAKGAKVGLLMFEVRRSAARVALALRADDLELVEAGPDAGAEDFLHVSSYRGVSDAGSPSLDSPLAPTPAIEDLAASVYYEELAPVAAVVGEPVAAVVEEPAPAPVAAEDVPMPVAEVAPVEYGTYIEPPVTPYYAQPVPPVSPWGNPLTSVAPVEPNGHNGHNGHDSNWS